MTPMFAVSPLSPDRARQRRRKGTRTVRPEGIDGVPSPRGDGRDVADSCEPVGAASPRSADAVDSSATAISSSPTITRCVTAVRETSAGQNATTSDARGRP